MTCGIYKLNFTGTNSVYIGKSKNIEYRFIRHRYDMRSGRASNKLLHAYATYGLPELEVLYECEEAGLSSMEAEAIEVFDSIKNGFNTVVASITINTSYAFGENSGNSVYSNSSIESVFLYLVEMPELTYTDIELLTGVNKSTIAMLVCGQQHSWLKNIYGEKYVELVNIGTRRQIIYKHPNLREFISFIRLANELPDKTITELATLVGVSEDILRNISSGRTASKLLMQTIPDEYKIFRARKHNSRTTAEYKGKVIPPLINIITGEVVEGITNIAEFSRERSLTPSAIGAVINGKRPTHKGWKILKSCMSTEHSE